MQKERTITVLNSRHSYASAEKVPSLLLEGIWLKNLGFNTGDFAKIECEDGKITIFRKERSEVQPFLQEAECIDKYMVLTEKERRKVMKAIQSSN